LAAIFQSTGSTRAIWALVEAIETVIADFSADEAARLLAGNAERVYRI
jgi:hypothetical protein